MTITFCAFANSGSGSRTVDLSSAPKKGKVQGRVTTGDGRPLKEASIAVGGTTNGTSTDAYGDFMLKGVPADAELVISYVGLSTVKLKPVFDQPMNVKMAISTIAIQKVVINPEPESATLSVTSDEFGIKIKGIIDNKPPLYVLDGKVIDKSEFNKLGADRIDHISVLKDSSEIKKYGEEGKNGIIQITSKKIISTPAVRKIGDIKVIGADSKKEQKPPFPIREEMPQFPGGERRMMYYFSAYTKYPAQAKADKIEGTVEVSFMVGITGKVERVKIVKSAHPALDTEAYRVVCSMPYWTPGKQNGNPAEVFYTIPIEFRL